MVRKLTTSEGHEFHVFESVAEVDSFVDKSQLTKYIEGQSSFIGREFESADDVEKALKTQWGQGVLTMEMFLRKLEQAEIPTIKDLKTRKVWNSEEGELDFERMMAGNPNCMCKTVTEKTDGVPEVTVVIDTAAPASIHSLDLLWRGAAALALVKILEQNGYRTEVWAIAGATIYDGTPHVGVVPSVCLKRPGDPLDISTLINTVSGWFFRSETFGLYATIAHRENRDLAWGLGKHFIPTASQLDVMVTDQKRVYSSGFFTFEGSLGLIESELQRIADEE